ncbi:phosphatidate cytidylyltransferase [Mollicutes bacterium LVI A0039]|nr:phosphatidate cytidylyltransferase [Mollicutes bacterium LVI A0039]
MNKRIIGAIGFVGLFYLSLLLGKMFLVLLAVFFMAGIYELRNIYLKSTVKTQVIGYGIAFVLAIVSLGYLSVEHVPLIIYITALLMLNDSLAYAVGMTLGKHKLSKISPNKTIEGSVGGLLLSPFATIAVMKIVHLLLANVTISFIPFDFSTLVNYNPFSSLFILIIVSFVIAILGQIGDLVESYFKRSAEIKDSGFIVYGHGGILDRIDSWIFPMILMTIIMLFI